MIPFDQINAVALSQLPSLLNEWLPNGRKQGHEFVVGGIDGAPGRSLSINLNTCQWSDFADGELKGGDPISLYAAIFHERDRVRAARDLGRKLGVSSDTVDPAPVHRVPAPISDWSPSLPPPDAPTPDLSRWDLVYPYRNSEGQIVRYVLRRNATEHDRKKIIPLTWGTLKGETGWHQRHPASPRALYALDRIAACETVLICEGEKSADAAQRMLPRMACTTWTAGTGNVASSDWSSLHGKKVIIWPDNDDPGLKAASEIAEMLAQIASTVRTVDVSDMGPGEDAADLQTDNIRDWLQPRIGPITCGTAVKIATAMPPIVMAGRRAAGIDPIQVRAGEIDLAATAGERALIAANAPVFQRGSDLVRPGRRDVAAANGRMTLAACLVEVTPPAMVDLLCQAVEWQKWNKRAGEFVQIDPPREVAAVIMGRSGVWAFRPLAGVITTPTLRPDGSLLSAPGYDAETRLYHVDDPTLEISVPAPSRSAAETALFDLNCLLDEFPFATDVDRAVALSAIITGVCRGMMPVSPLFAFRATTPGSGKSFLVDVASVVATGRVCPVTSAGEDTNEMDKRLAGLLLAGYPIMSLDNINGELGSDLMCQAIERPIIRIRELGSSSSTEIENRSVIFATGNGLRVKGDMTRRTVLCTLDPGMEQPELREFSGNPIQQVVENRGKYVSCCLTVVQSWMASGEKSALSPLASFEVWSQTVRAALVWLGQKDPCRSMESAREDDPEGAERREVIWLLSEALGVGPQFAKSVREIEDMANIPGVDESGSRSGYRYPDLRDVLQRIAGTPNGKLNSRKLGWWLTNNKGRLEDGLMLVGRETWRKTKEWYVEKP